MKHKFNAAARYAVIILIYFYYHNVSGMANDGNNAVTCFIGYGK